MKPHEQKEEFIRMRAEGKSYSVIASTLHISKSTCCKWEQDFKEEIGKLKKDSLTSLYENYHMTKEARIKRLGETLEKVDNALNAADLTEVPPEKLLDYKLKYTEALQKEYVSTGEAFKLEGIDPRDIVKALGDLLNRVRSGEVSTDQANKESLILSNLLKAYDTAEVKAKLDELETVIGGR